MKQNDSTDFMIFGTFLPTYAYLLKEELEKRRIIAKLLYPGTNISPDAEGNASFTELTVLIEGKDFELAKKVCRELRIKPVRKMTLFSEKKSLSALYIFAIALIIFVAVLVIIFRY